MGSLVLTIRLGGEIKIGDDITIKVLRINPGQVKIAFDAPPDVVILRDNAINRVKKEKPKDDGFKTTNS